MRRDGLWTLSATAAFVLTLTLSAAGRASPDGPLQPEDAPFARYPAVSPDGSTVAFSYQGDVFTVPVSGGEAQRLTLHEAYDAHPRWSRDGSRIAFQSDRYGNDDLFVMTAEGQRIRRITHHSADDALGGWTPDDRIVFSTRRTYVQVEWEREIHHVAASGGTPDRLLDAVGYAPRVSPDGRFIAFTFGANRRYRKGYRGSADKDVWLYDTRSGAYRQITDFDGNDMRPAWGGPRDLFFVSERSGTYNLHRVEVDEEGRTTGSVRQLTRFQEDGVRYFGVSADGSTVVLERRTELYRLRPADVGEVGGPDGAGAEPLEIEIPGDDRFYAVERKTFSDEAEEYAVSPDGDYVAFVVRGEIFLTPNDPEEERTVRLTRHPWRDRDVAWLDDHTLVFASDRDGDYDLYRLSSADPEEEELYFALRFRTERMTDSDVAEREPTPSPDGERLAFRRGRGTLVVADLREGELRGESVLRDGWATPEDLAWSPDSRWLAYALPDLNFNEEVYVHAADGSRGPVNVSQHPRPDHSPHWSPDGSRLGFISNRNNGDDDVWFVWLREEDWERTKEDWELLEAREKAADREEEDGEDDAEDETPTVEIDFDRIHERLQQVTALPGNESDVRISPDGETFYFVTNRDGWKYWEADQNLYRVQWDGTEMKALTEGDPAPSSVSLGPDGEHLFMLVSGGLERVGADDGERESLPFAAEMEIRHRREREQVFAEAWRLLERNFYDPEFHGRSWEKLREKYRPWAMRASTKRDFRDVFNMMLGELNASHLGLYGPDRAETQEVRTGLLGVEIDPVDAGVRVERVVPESPADRDTSRLREGEVITAVDGEPVRPGENFYRLLSDRVDERTVLDVRGRDGQRREVVIRPTGSLSDELYEEWVRRRRELTERYSDGRLGYIHVRAMVWPSFERFERELVASGEGKEGLLVDVRFNGGGWTTDYLLTVLTYPQHAYTVPRGAAEDLDAQHERFRQHYPFGERLPQAWWTKPTAALCNASSFSNAEIFSHAYKTLDLGTLVGEPTFGAVISTGGAGLIDGSFVRLPFRGWYVKATDRNMENGPAVPDVIVRRRPDDRADGEDEQLRAAVKDLLGRIGEEGEG